MAETHETLQLKGVLEGHNGWVTQIASNPKYPEMILSSSRGKLMLLKKKIIRTYVRNSGTVIVVLEANLGILNSDLICLIMKGSGRVTRGTSKVIDLGNFVAGI